jgi:hypothetical protein
MRPLRPTSAVLVLLAVATTFAVAGCGDSAEETGETSPAGAPASTSTAPEGQQAPLGVRAKSCGGDAASGGEIHVTGVSCAVGRELVADWHEDRSCSPPPGASRSSCRLGRFQCFAASTDRGIAVACAGPSRSVAFIAPRPG